MEESVIDWLLNSDPSINFQVKRDLLDLPKKKWKSNQEEISIHGWGKKLLDLQDNDGRWSNGLYIPKFTSTHYTLLLLRRMEMIPNDQTKRGCKQLVKIKAIGETNPNIERLDTCITGMGLGILAHFKFNKKGYFFDIVEFLINRQLGDGGWNCRHPRIKTNHSSVHTTLSVLEGLEFLARNYPNFKIKIDNLREPAHEFLLSHELYKSHSTGKIIHPDFIDISFPPRWKYNILSALDYFQSINFDYDDRMAGAIEIIKKKCKNGFWNKGKQMSGAQYFSFNSPRTPSKWNTLRALRVMKIFY